MNSTICNAIGRIILSFLVFATFVVAPLASWAAPITIVVPSAAAATEGNSGGSVSGDFRIQQVIDASEFSGPVSIIGIAFRPDGAVGAPFTTTLADFLVRLSTTPKSPDGLDPTFASNIGLDVTTVFNGPITNSSNNTGPAGGPKDFDLVVSFTTPFYYDPSLGNLLYDQQSFSGLTVAFTFDAQDVFADSISMINSGAASATGTAFTAGAVMQFIIPEPSSLALAAFGFVALAAWGWRRRKG